MKRTNDNTNIGVSTTPKINDNIFIGVPTEDFLITASNVAVDSFTFRLKEKIIMEITPEGFFWNGTLVENDKEIYEKFKEFLEMSKPPKPKPFNADTYESTISLMKQALLFYANSWNYQDKITNPAPIAFDDYGSQARFALSQLEQLEFMKNNMVIDYSNLKIEEPITNIDDITQIIKDNL